MVEIFEEGQGLAGPYDFINCSGVLHHLSIPHRSLFQLERHLILNAVLSLMVYNHSNRNNIQNAQCVITLLTKDIDNSADLEREALEICHRASASNNQLRATFNQSVEIYHLSPSEFADTMLNPREVSYSVPELIELLAAVGLELVSPAVPNLWNLRDILPEPAYERFLELPKSK